MKIFSIKWNVVSDISKELDGSSVINNIITGRSVKSFKSWWIASRSYINKNYGRKYEQIIPMR